MAIAEVGSSSQRASVEGSVAFDTKDLPFPGNVTSGSLLIVAGAMWNTSTQTLTVTDTLGTSYTVEVSAGMAGQGGFYQTFIAYGIASSGGANTVTIDPSVASAFGSFAIDEFSGVHSSPLDVNGGTSTGTSTTPSDGITTVATNALIIGVMTHSSVATETLTPGGDYTEFGTIETPDGSPFSAVYRIVTPGPYTVGWTIGNSRDWVAQTMSFKEAVSGPVVPSVNDAVTVADVPVMHMGVNVKMMKLR